MMMHNSESCGIIFECQICFEDYNPTNKKPVVLECGHSICHTCIQSIFTSNQRGVKRCPFDNKELKRSIDQYPINWSYIDIITNYKKFNKPLNEYSNYKELNFGEGRYSGQVDLKNQNIRNGFGQLEYKDGSVYIGYWKDNKRSGKGKFKTTDKREYEGEWEDDMPNGYGKYVFSAGEIKSYEGTWRMGKFFGMGKITYFNNSELETIFIDGVACSDIHKIKTEDERVIVGKFEENESNQIKGNGCEVGRNGEVFIGHYNTNKNTNNTDVHEHFPGSKFKLKKNGKGRIHFRDGRKYDGFFENDMMNGRGNFHYKDGSQYEGEFKDNVRNGKGVLTSINEEIYDGDWFNDKRWGRGTMTTKSGDVFKGQWENDKKSGPGKLMLSNGYSFDGSWTNDKKEGKGVETFPNEESYYGDFKNDLKEGKGLFVFKNGDTYKGEWHLDKMHGKGTLVTRDGEEIVAKFSKGMIVKENSKEGKDKNCFIF